MRRLVAEWEPADAVLLMWPDPEGDFRDVYADVLRVFDALATTIADHAKVLVAAASTDDVAAHLRHLPDDRLILFRTPLDDCWARDAGPLTVEEDGRLTFVDCRFNAWGLKYPASHDNQLVRRLHDSGILSAQVGYENAQHLVLEGGAIDTDGRGTILTTESCLLSFNRNGFDRREQAEEALRGTLGAQRVLWLTGGALEGDDTDGHVDTMARFVNPDTIAYIRCDDPNHPHHALTQRLESELRAMTTPDGAPYRLIPLPCAPDLWFEGRRLPATYANFLIVNDAVLVPVYGLSTDDAALAVLASAFPNHRIRPVNCAALVTQGGSLHCVTMQLPRGVLP